MKSMVLSALLASMSLSAATVSGTVSTLGGEAIPDAKVLVSNLESGMKQEVTTSSDGTFSISGAGAGQYILKVAKPGFNWTFRMFDVKADSNMNRKITMGLDETQQTPDEVTDSYNADVKP
ncbi:MAG: carboxypeptidase-like regulatory domain-containing protein [Bryobacteraceae bacterium]